jgi:hypothetical protein
MLYVIVNGANRNWFYPRGRYPNLPVAMRSDRSGQLLNVTRSWLSAGFGISRTGCTLEQAWNAWRCPSGPASSYRMLVLENLDADNEIRRIRYPPAS